MRSKASDHLKNAINEVNAALALAQDHAVVHHLQHIHRVLDKAEPIYGGHRGNAMHQVNRAIGDLESELKQRGLKGHHHKHHHMPARVSDLEVKAALGELQGTLKGISSLQPTGWRSSSAGHMKNAISELHKALAVSKDHVYAAELRSIYHLIDKADPIYQGHRGNAMREINRAIGNLEKEMGARGLKAHHHKHAWVPEDVSDWRIHRARHALKHVETRLAMHANSEFRKKADGHLKAAIAELGNALASVQNGKK